MKRLRYQAWNGRPWLREGGLPAAGLFDQLAGFMDWGLTPQEALDWMARKGLESQGRKTQGSEALLEALRKKRQELFGQLNLDHVLDDLRLQIGRIVELELATARRELGWQNPRFLAREETLRGLPQQVSAALAALAQYRHQPGFLDAQALALLEKLLAQEKRIQGLEEFIRRYGQQFKGLEPVDFSEGERLMAQFNQITSLSEAMRGGGGQADLNLDGLDGLLGQEAAAGVERLLRLPQTLEEEGFIRREGGQIRLTPKGLEMIGRRALEEIFKGLKKDRLGLHAHHRKGDVGHSPETVRPYEFGAAFQVELVATLKKALMRGLPQGAIRLQAEDFMVLEEASSNASATVLLLDLSWSMSRDGRFPAAKRVALALDHLIRSLYPRDAYHTVGFSTRAKLMPPGSLPEATWDPADPFTNLQEGLALARSLLRRHRTPNRQIIVVTDGQPTATHLRGETNAQWPGYMGSIPPEIERETLKEVVACTREKITINTFMLDNNPVLTRFIDEITRLNRGRAFFTVPSQLGHYLLRDYLAHRNKIIRA